MHDVIDAIQNGESDVDMESDTSDSSDEQVVENVEEVEKENQRPTDCPTNDDDGKDIEQTNTSQPNHNICAVKWYDNRAVTLVSSFAGIDPVQKIQRWNKATKSYIEVERPHIVGAYNKYMGGVDLLDSFAAKYKFLMKLRR